MKLLPDCYPLHRFVGAAKPQISNVLISCSRPLDAGRCAVAVKIGFGLGGNRGIETAGSHQSVDRRLD
jgi:hypothetical protein